MLRSEPAPQVVSYQCKHRAWANTHAERLKRDIEDAHGALINNEPRPSHEQQLHDDAATAWNMNGSLLQDFAQHEPLTMFGSNPDTGSTIPDNTYMQQRLVREALDAPQQHDSASVHSLALQSDGSLRSSAFRTTQATNRSPASARETRNSQLSKAEAGKSTTPVKSRTQSQTTQQHRLPDISESNEEPNIERTPNQENYDDQNISRPSVPVAEITLEAGVSEVELETSEMIRVNVEATRVKRKKRSEAEVLKQLDDAQAFRESHNSDEIAAVGLPPEMYKPRPSRSRSAQSALESKVELDADPETIMKQRRKRRKTVDTDVAMADCITSLDPQSVGVVKQMGFSDARAVEALTLSSGDLAAAIELLIQTDLKHGEKSPPGTITASADKRSASTEPARDVQMSHATTKQPTGPEVLGATVCVQVPAVQIVNTKGQQEPAGVASESLEGLSTETDCKPTKHGDEIERDTAAIRESSEVHEPPNRQVIAKRGRGRPRKTPLNILTEDEALEAEALVDPPNDEQENVPPQEDPPRTKRRRGRPKSVKSTEHDVVKVCQDECQDENVAVQEGPEQGNASATRRGDTTVLQDIDLNRGIVLGQLSRDDVFSGNHTEERRCTQTVTPGSSPPRLPAALIAPVTPTKQKVKNGQHSPSSKSKVPYRVGLSRHARIPSLLKMLKK